MSQSLSFNITPDELEVFLEEVNDCLQVMETGILTLEKRPDEETLNAVFRAAHTLKALAGAIGHRPMAELTHTMETLFDAMREATLSLSAATADELLAMIDVLKRQRDEIVSRRADPVDIAPYLARLNALLSLAVEEGAVSSVAADLPDVSAAPETVIVAPEGEPILEIEVLVAADAYAPAARLYQVALAMQEVGQVISQRPVLENFSETDKSLWLLLATQASAEEVEAVLADILDLARFTVKPYLAEAQAETDLSDLGLSLEIESNGEFYSDEIVAEVAADPSDTSSADRGRPDGPTRRNGESTVRISIDRLDRLVNLVGELATNRTRLLQIENILSLQYTHDSHVAGLGELAPHFSHLVDQLQEEVMRARMLPIAALFNKLPRLVRDTARAAGKQVDLHIEGSTTELDRAVIESISDPLIHLIRNAIDHGLESPQERQRQGKPASGTLGLSAASVEGQIVITVSDDGRGINSDRVRQAAVRTGLLPDQIDEATQLSDEEVTDLIFRPNLSTAEAVTEISGRGVGLDVVRTNIEQLGGSVIVASSPGHGTTFELTLPLTLALIQTMLVVVRNTLYAVPLAGVSGALYLADAVRHSVGGKSAMEWQEETVPLLDLREFFASNTLPGLNGHTGFSQLADQAKPSIILVNWAKHQVGLVVDRIIGQQEIVIKSLSPLMGQMPGLSGATILGDGQIALIVDIPSMIKAALRANKGVGVNPQPA